VLSGTPPTAWNIPDLYVYEDAADEVINLFDYFDDIEDADEDMTYEVVGNTNSSLFDSVDIDAYEGYGGYGGLYLDFAPDAYGEAELTVRATDTDGLWVETSFTVNVESVNSAPEVAASIPDVYVYEDAADEVINLFDYFDDIEDADEDMTYEVVGNTNSSLFDSVDIDAYEGYGGYGGLYLDFAPDAYGEAELTVRATDTDGLWVETSFTVNVESVNDAPVISGFFGTVGPVSYWTFSGMVTDVDDVVEGMVVTFGGVLSSYQVTATVQSDGTFSLTDQFVGLQSGTATAQTNDDEPLASNEAWYYVVIT